MLSGYWGRCDCCNKILFLIANFLGWKGQREEKIWTTPSSYSRKKEEEAWSRSKHQTSRRYKTIPETNNSLFWMNRFLSSPSCEKGLIPHLRSCICNYPSPNPSETTHQMQTPFVEAGKNQRFPFDGRRVYPKPRAIKTYRRESPGMCVWDVFYKCPCSSYYSLSWFQYEYIFYFSMIFL